MPSENNHIDNFFRNKAAEATVDYSNVDAGWNQMQSLLPKPEVLPLPQSQTGSLIVKFLTYAAVAVVVSTVIVGVTRSKRESQSTNNNVPHIEIATRKSNPLPVITDTSVPYKDTTRVIAFRRDQYSISSTLTEHEVSIEEPNTVPTLQVNTKPDSKSVFTLFYDLLSKPGQEFTIDNRRDTTIICNEKTSLFIPANCFKTQSDLPVNGYFKISVKEFYDYADIVSNKLSTTSGGMPIETGGMLHISATYSNEPVLMRSGMVIDIKMPAQDFKPDMRLFVAEPSRSIPPDSNDPSEATGSWLDWKDAGQRQLFINERSKLVRVLDWDQPAETWSDDRGKWKAKFYVSRHSDFSVDEVRRELESRLSNKYDVIKVRKERKRHYQTPFISIGHRQPVTIGDSTLMPLSFATKKKLISRQDSIAFEERFKKQVDEAIKANKQYAKYLQQTAEYNFKISNLGWINCDRFLTYPRSRLTDMAFDPGPGFEGMFFEAKMIFQEEKSVMPGYWNNGKVVFQNLPVGHKVHLICTGAKDGKIFASFQEITIKPLQSPLLQFEETSPRDFKYKLSQYGSVK